MMQGRVAAVVSLEHVAKYFVKPTWKKLGKWGYESVFKRYQVTFEPVTTLYYVKIEAIDDPTDQDESVTDNPLQMITDFLGEDIPGGEIYARNASMRRLSHLLRYTSQISRTARILRRVALFVDYGALHRVITAFVDANWQQVDLEKLFQEIKKKGWHVEFKEEDDIPILYANISDIYEVTIQIDKIQYDYELQVMGVPEADASGSTHAR